MLEATDTGQGHSGLQTWPRARQGLGQPRLLIPAFLCPDLLPRTGRFGGNSGTPLLKELWTRPPSRPVPGEAWQGRGTAGCEGCRPPLCDIEWGRRGWAPWVSFPIRIPARQVQGSSACAGLFKEPQILERISLGAGDQAFRGVEKLTPQPQLPGVLQENDIPGVGLTGASGK